MRERRLFIAGASGVVGRAVIQAADAAGVARLAHFRPKASAPSSDAQTAVQRAEGDYVNAVYDYHKAVAALEAAVGRPLR